MYYSHTWENQELTLFRVDINGPHYLPLYKVLNVEYSKPIHITWLQRQQKLPLSNDKYLRLILVLHLSCWIPAGKFCLLNAKNKI